MRRVVGVNQSEIIKQWDEIARLRADQIQKSRDLSYTYVLVPTILKLSTQSDFTAVIDIGCGPGFLIKKLCSKARRFVGIDMSKEMIKIAKAQCANLVNVEIRNSTIENFARNTKMPSFTLAIANMSLMTTLRLDKVLRAVAHLLRPKAHFIFTITHPYFWPFYHGYASKNWFDYKKETLIEDIFRISLESPESGPKTIHVHRPLEQYLCSLAKSGFVVDQICEPMPSEDIRAKYPKLWKYPRFLGMRCIRV
ncbi:class I SAM-dependent methyltransferase [Chloroflexota bacterium]